jgi:uncharacterized protein YidB (DUF937 family)
LTYINAEPAGRRYPIIAPIRPQKAFKMQFVHHIIDDLNSPPEADVTPMDAAIEELLGGERGSLADLADHFTKAKLGHIMASWGGKGPYLAVTPHDLRLILGEERTGDLATLTGLPSEEFLARLARRLPKEVHRRTPKHET